MVKITICEASQMGLVIRKASGRDAAGILEYCRIIGSETDNLTFGSEGIAASEDGERAFLENISSSDRSIYLVADLDGEIVGTCTYTGYDKERLSHRGELSISVKKSMWGRHIGTMLMEEVLSFAKNSAKAEIISLEVRSDNKRAAALYRKFGFRPIGTFTGFMKIGGKYIDCDIFQLDLR